MARTLEEINEAYRKGLTCQNGTGRSEQYNAVSNNTDPNRKRKKGRMMSALVSNFIFYGAIAMLIFAAVTVSAGDSNGAIAGYRYYHILSGSMESVYPRGSFVIVKDVGKDEIKVGDDISFYQDQNTVLTHRVIDILEDYEENGARGYQTQGTESLNPDPDITHEANVAGKVVYSIPRLGLALDFIREHMVFVAGMFLVAVLASFLIRMIYRQKAEREAEYQ